MCGDPLKLINILPRVLMKTGLNILCFTHTSNNCATPDSGLTMLLIIVANCEKMRAEQNCTTLFSNKLIMKTYSMKTYVGKFACAQHRFFLRVHGLHALVGWDQCIIARLHIKGCHSDEVCVYTRKEHVCRIVRVRMLKREVFFVDRLLKSLQYCRGLSLVTIELFFLRLGVECELMMPSLGVLANLCRNNIAIQAQVKALV